MPSKSITLVPGVNSLRTPTLNEAGISSSNMIRFMGGLVQKRGGWNLIAFSGPFPSPPRALCGFKNNLGYYMLGIGGTGGLWLFEYNGGTTNVITPRFFSTNPGNAFSATNGSAVITVTDPGSYMTTNDTVYIPPVTVGGINIVGLYQVASVTSTSVYTINVGTNAIATNSNTGFTQILHWVFSGSSTAALSNLQTEWCLAGYGQDLAGCAIGGPIFLWDYTSNGFSKPAAILPNAPPLNTGIVTSDAAQQIIAYGSSQIVAGQVLQDLNLIRWCDTGNTSAWTATVANLAGSLRVPTGSQIVGMTACPQGFLVFTDIDVWLMQYIGGTLVYGLTKLASGCGLKSQFAHVKFGTSVFWMSQGEFWVYNGGTVQELPCPIFDNVFPVINPNYLAKLRTGSNGMFNEVMWFFTSTASAGENDTYACFNPVEGTWDYGLMPRAGWIDQSVLGAPLGADPLGYIYQHETSNDANGAAINASFQTGYFLLDEGESFSFVDWIRPDFKFTAPGGGGTIQVTVLVSNYPGDAPSSFGPYSFTGATEFITTRCRGRLIALKFASTDVGSAWRIGRTQVRFATDGRR